MKMEKQDDINKSYPNVEIKLDGDDTKYITSLSTILVATIQEAKDRISQMEYIFCSQIYPKFQTKARSMQDIYGEAKQAAETMWREKENDLLQEIEKLKHEKEEVVAENQSLKVEMSELSAKLRVQQLRVDEHESLDKLVQGLEEELKLKGAELVNVKLETGELQKKLEAKDAELMDKEEKCSNLLKKHKRLKSQHLYVLKKHGYTSDNMLPQSTSVELEHSLRGEMNQIDKLCMKKSNVKCVVDEGHIEVKEEKDIDDDLEEEEKSSNPSLPSSSRDFITARSDTRKSYSVVAGMKRPAGSSWIETRAHQNQPGPDPHDDFLNTPFENIKENLNKAKRGEASGNVPEKMNFFFSDDDDDETQDMNVDPCPQKQQQTTVPCDGKKSFKYVEPVRKKADRENLKGIECKQCKKFYDAVLPENEGTNTTDLRCEHHDGVSRHRYKYVPPMTPDGFWNIGFESEM